MLTPNELKERKFDKAVFGGYDMAAVDEFMSTVSQDYTALFKENAVLKKKLKLLADTVEDYRGVDEAMRKALITAQNMANEMVADAEKKSREMIDTASAEAKLQIAELTRQVADEEAKLALAKKETAEFFAKISALYDAENKKLAALREETVPAPVEEPVHDDKSDTLEEIAKSLDEKVKQEEEKLNREETSTAENAAEEDALDIDEKPVPNEPEKVEEAEETRRFDFSELKFGRDYDIRDEK